MTLIVLGALLVVVLILAGLVWLTGWDVGRRLAPQRAALVEAGEETADRIADFRDWVRLRH